MIVKVVLLTKDEYDLIEDFIKYYSYLFGISNIVIIDNGSTDQTVFATYFKYIPQGLTVIQDTSPFQEANVFMTRHIRDVINKHPETEWIMCLETDEFLFRRADLEGAIEPRMIHDYLASVPDNVTCLRYKHFWGSVVDPIKLGEAYCDGLVKQPVHHITEFYNQNWDKPLVRAKAFVAMTQWLHHAHVSYGEKMVCEELGLLHYHNTGKRRLFERAKNVLMSIGVLNGNENLEEAYEKVHAFHEKQCSHAHKAGYVEDVLLRMIRSDDAVYVEDMKTVEFVVTSVKETIQRI